MGVDIIGVGIDVEESTIEEYFACTVSDAEENFFYAEDFSAVRGLANEVGEVVCFEDVSMPTTTRLTTTESDNSGYDAECDSTDSLDIVLLLDASGSVYDAGYENWQSELDLARLIVERALPLDSRVSLTVFSGCVKNKNFTQCADAGYFEQKFALDEYSELADVSGAIAAMGSADFTGGYTWTDEALAMALSEFEANSAAARRKAIVLVTDGEPYPSNAGHSPCQAPTGYVSDTTMALRAMNVSMIAVGIDLAQSTIDDSFSCAVDEFLSAQDFAALSALSWDIRELLCTDDVVEEMSTTQSAVKGCGCVENYVPYCCDGMDFANACEAECTGFNVTASCTQAECSDVSFDDDEENSNTAREVSWRSALLFLSVFLSVSL